MNFLIFNIILPKFFIYVKIRELLQIGFSAKVYANR